VNKSHAGARFERKIRNLLEENGWWVVRAAASRGEADLIAFRKGHPPLFVQAKRNGRLDYTEWNQLYDLCESLGTVPVLAFQQRLPNIPKIQRLAERKGEAGNQGKRAPLEDYPFRSE